MEAEARSVVERLGTPFRSVDNVVRDATNPCALVLQSKGYRLSLLFIRRPDGKLDSEYVAKKDSHRFAAQNEVELLGLVAMWEARGVDWPTQPQEPFVYGILYSESMIRELDGSEIENPQRLM